MDWYPLFNSLRIAAISAVVVFFAGIAAAYYIAKLPRLVKGVLDVFLTLPLVLPPTVVGYLLLRVLGPKRLIGAWVLQTFGTRLVMTWWSAIFATVVVVFPLMYRTVRGAGSRAITQPPKTPPPAIQTAWGGVAFSGSHGEFVSICLIACSGRCRSQPFATKERYGCGSAACRYTSACAGCTVFFGNFLRIRNIFGQTESSAPTDLQTSIGRSVRIFGALRNLRRIV